MRKTLAEALAVLVTVCSPSWAEGSPQDAGDRIGSGSPTLALDLGFYPLPPCRAVDTRVGAPLISGTPRTFLIGGVCGVPGTAKALSINVTVVGPTASGFVTLWPADLPEPATSTINFQAATTRANNAVATLATDGSGRLSAKALLADSGPVHLVIDVTGYMARDPLAPCLCPIDGAPVPVIFSINPSAGGVGSTVTLAGSSLAENPQVRRGDRQLGADLVELFQHDQSAGTATAPRLQLLHRAVRRRWRWALRRNAEHSNSNQLERSEPRWHRLRGDTR